MYIGTQPYHGFRARHTYTATAGQTSFSGAGAENVSLSYSDEMYIDVYQNGVKLSPADYTATSGTTVVLAQGASADDIVEVLKYDTFAVADTVSAKDGGGFGGDVSSSGTFLPTGDTAAGDAAAIGFTSAEGLILTGQGSTNDITIKNDADTAVIQIPTGTDDVNFTDNIALKSDSAQISFGADSEVTIDHVHNTGLTIQGSQLNTNLSLLAFDTTNGTTPDFRLGKSSNATVGTIAETADAEALGQIRFTGADSNNASRDAASIVVTQNGSSTGSAVPGEMTFNTFGSERFRIRHDGFVRASPNSSVTNARLSATTAHVFHSHTDGSIMFFLENTQSDPFGMMFDYSQAAPDDNTNFFMKFEDSSAERAFIYSDGDMYNHDGTFAQISDERIKDNVTDANSQWNDIKAMRFVNYQRKDDIRQYGKDKAKVQLGLLSQELEKVSPNLVRDVAPNAGDILSSSEFGTLYEDGDDIPSDKVIGDVKEVKDKVKGVAYSILYMKAVKALQEAMTRIETLEAEVKTLKGE